MEYFVTWGCYLEMVAAKCTTDKPEDAINEALYWMAREATEGCVGMHGFDVDEDEENYEEAERELVENAVNYYFEPWNEKEHAPKCTYGFASEPDEIEL